MLKIRHVFIVLGMLLYPLASLADVSVSIGINLPVYPNLVLIPGYPVYYAPRLQANFFFTRGCTGFIRMINGIPVHGTTAPGGL